MQRKKTLEKRHAHAYSPSKGLMCKRGNMPPTTIQNTAESLTSHDKQVASC